MRSLEHDLAELHDLDEQANAAAKVINIEDELMRIVCPLCLTFTLGVYS